MGTNYYVEVNKPCPECGHAKEVGKVLHMGKFSSGWRFQLHIEEGYWTDTYSLIDFLIKYRLDDGYYMYNDNGAVDAPLNIITQIVDSMGDKETPEKDRDGRDDLSDHFTGEFC